MPKIFSDTYNRTVNSLEGKETPLVLLEIDHEDLPEPLRVVGDYQDLTHSGDVFQAMGFEFVEPNDPESGRAEAKLRIDNIGRELMEWLETADWASPTTVRIIFVLRSNPNNVEYEITMGLKDIEATPDVVEGTLSFDDFYGMPAVAVTYNAITAPGLA